MNCDISSAVPSGPPLNVSARAVDSMSLLASWLPPHISQRNGIIRQYRINLTESETGVITYYTVQNSLQTTLTDLHPYYNDQVTVAAITIGQGPYSTEATVQLPEAGQYNLISTSTLLTSFLYRTKRSSQ